MALKFNFALILLLVFTQTIQAKNQRALLVGVSNYYHLAPKYQLDGPAHDAIIVNKMLRSRGFQPENIKQLVSSKDKNKDTEPTRSNILAALNQLAKSSKSGDFVYLHFAGHGSRQPAKAKSNDEADGLDEIFLPADAKKWNSYIGSVENAITDNDIATHIDRIRNKGSDVWVVFDSCHSGSMTRGIGQSEVRYRKILGNDLGIPDSLVNQSNSTIPTPMNEARSRGHLSDSPQDNQFLVASSNDSIANKNIKKGSLITFSAAQSEQTTPEMKLPRGSEDRRYHGLFTYTLMEILAKNRGISYQQLAQQVMSRYQTVPWHTTTPLLSATNMNASVFNETGTSVDQWQAIRKQKLLTIPAGRLNQLSKGAVVGLYASATSKLAIAKATVTKSQAMQSQASINSRFENKKINFNKIPEKVYVRILAPQIDFQLAVSVIKTKGQTNRVFDALNKGLSNVAEKNPLLIRQEKDGDKANLFVTIFDDKLWFISPDQHLPCHIQYGLSKKELEACKRERKPERLSYLDYNDKLPGSGENRIRENLRQGLLRIAKARNLLAIQSALGKQDKTLKLDFLVEKGNSKIALYKPAPKLKTGDWVNLSIENTSNKGQGITVLFVDSQFGIQLAHPRSGEPNVLKPKESLKLRFQVNVDTTGYEHLVVLHAESTGIVQSYSFLEQPPLSVSTRGHSQNMLEQEKSSPLQRMMQAAKTGMQMSRGLALGGDKPAPQSGLNIFSWQTLP